MLLINIRHFEHLAALQPHSQLQLPCRRARILWTADFYVASCWHICSCIRHSFQRFLSSIGLMLVPVVQAMRRSLLEQGRAVLELPEAPVFRPSTADFKDPLAYIAKIQSHGAHAGIAKIIPPQGVWGPFMPSDLDFARAPPAAWFPSTVLSWDVAESQAGSRASIWTSNSTL